MAKKAPKQAKKLTTKAANKPAARPKKGPRTKAAKKPTRKPAKKTGKRAAKGPPAVEATWIVWQNVDGIQVGTTQEFYRSKRKDAIVCDVINTGERREFDALHRAVQLGKVLRQTYANCLTLYGETKLSGQWLKYDDAAQEQRIREWERRLSR